MATSKQAAPRTTAATRGSSTRRSGTAASTVTRVLNCVPSQHPEADWGLEQATATGTADRAGPIPASVDLRTPWWKVNDQGSTGSCVGQATADGLCRWHFVKAGRLGPSELLSIRYVWMAAKETDSLDSMPSTFLEAGGTSLKAALDIARKYGVVTATELPFTGGLYPGDPKTFFALAATRKITSYYRLQQSEWKSWLATTGPILTRLDVDTTWDDATVNHGNLDTYRGPGRGGHAVAVVGYTPTRFIVRNSWGSSWGDAGFGYASVAYAKKAFTESYGIRVG